jgi:large subunit ribosomal protein L21
VACIVFIEGGNILYAVVRSGGRQYRVQAGDQFLVEKLSAEAGQQLTLDEVLLVADEGKAKVGTPLVKGAKVKVTVVGQERGPKIRIFKYRPKQRYRRRLGHRQNYTRLRVDDIVVK